MMILRIPPRCLVPVVRRHRPICRSSFAREAKRLYHELSYSHVGEPADVLTYHADSTVVDDPPLTAPPGEQDLVQVEMLHVPWNPADVNMVQGKYPSPYDTIPDGLCKRPSNSSRHFSGRTVVGSEGWGRVVASQSETLPEGSLVTVAKPGLGTLRSSLWAPENAFLRIPTELLDQLGPGGSTLFQLGGTALRLLTDFVLLRPGDVVIQNAGNSGVGLMISQLATALFEAKVVSLIRRGSRTQSEFEELVEYLKTKGNNTIIIAEEDLEDHQLRKQYQAQIRELSGTGLLPKLALNSIGGFSAKSLLRFLESGGSLVTYGGMSGQPVTVATPQLIFKDVKVTGYWHSRWMVQNTPDDKQQLVDDLVRAVQEHHLECPPYQIFPLSEVQEALKWQARQGGVRSKLIFDSQY